MLRTTGSISLILLVAILSSCGNMKQMQYLQGKLDTATLSKIQFTEPVIQKGDLLGITVYSDDQLASAQFNQPVASASSPVVASGFTGQAQASSTVSGYLVNQDGKIQLFSIGAFHVEGMTRKELATALAQQYVQNNQLKNPYVEVRMLNFKVTLIGDVSKPGVYSLPTEKVSVLDAIGLAGDLTPYARRDNVLIIRETNGMRQFGRLDLTSTDALASPYYYLRQNDIIVVDVTKKKAAASDQSTARNITIAASVLSTIAIFINVFRN